MQATENGKTANHSRKKKRGCGVCVFMERVGSWGGVWGGLSRPLDRGGEMAKKSGKKRIAFLAPISVLFFSYFI